MRLSQTGPDQDLPEISDTVGTRKQVLTEYMIINSQKQDDLKATSSLLIGQMCKRKTNTHWKSNVNEPRTGQILHMVSNRNPGNVLDNPDPFCHFSLAHRITVQWPVEQLQHSLMNILFPPTANCL